MNIDKGTLIRTILLFVALLNQLLISLGKAPVPIDQQQVDAAYTIVSTIITVVISSWAWFKNNYVTKKGQQQKEALQSQGLANK